MVTSLVLLDPEFALRTLLVFGPLDEFNEFFIVFIKYPSDVKLLTSHSLMPVSTTIQTVVLMADRTHKFNVSLTKVEHIFAACRWTPRHVFMVHIHILLKSVCLVFVQILLAQKLRYVSWVDLYSALS